MKLVRFKLRPESPWQTPWRADTLAGMLCWMMARYDGGGRLWNEVLEPALAGCPRFVLSDAFPGDLFPTPKTVALFDWPQSVIKRVRKAEWIDADTLHVIQGGRQPSFENLFEEKAAISYGQVRNRQDRRFDFDETTVGRNGGELFQLAERELDFRHKGLIDARYLSVYARVESEFMETLETLWERLAETGFGADASVGRGQFELLGKAESFDWLDRETSEQDGLLCLSTFQPATADPTEGFWDSFVKYGKLGADYGLENVFKRPLLMLLPGACFLRNAPREFLGRAIPMDQLLSEASLGVLNGEGAKVAHLAFGLTVPMTFPAELKTELEKRRKKVPDGSRGIDPPALVIPDVSSRPMRPSSSSSRLRGDDYQHLYSWYLALGLLIEDEQIEEVRVEDREAGSVDDVTVRRRPGSGKPNRYFQIKYHVDHRESYSSDLFIRRIGKTSLLEKFRDSWRLLREQDPQGNIELVLFSNWQWVESEPVLKNLREDGAFKPEFYEAPPDKPLGVIREKWRAHLALTEPEFDSFFKSLRLMLGVGTETGLWFGGVTDRMRGLGLKEDENALLIATGLIRDRVKGNNPIIRRQGILEDIARHQLGRAPTERSVTIQLDSISHSPDEPKPDFRIDWRAYFLGDADPRGAGIRRDEDWNEVLLPSLRLLAEQVRTDELENGRIRLLRVSGNARLPHWLAFGFCFPEVAGYVLEFPVHPNQKNEPGLLTQWRTDSPANPDFRVVIDSCCDGTLGQTVDGEGRTVAVGLGLSSQIRYSVEGWLESRPEKVSAVLYLQPEGGPDPSRLKTAGDVVAVVKQSKLLMQEFLARRRASRLVLFYNGPAVGACFLGHRLNAVAAEAIVMNFVLPEYYPSFVLK